MILCKVVTLTAEELVFFLSSAPARRALCTSQLRALSVEPSRLKNKKNEGILDDSIADFADGFQNGALINWCNFLLICFRIKKCVNGCTRTFELHQQK